MKTQSKKRLEIMVDAHLVAHIRNCLLATGACDEFSVSPVLSGWTTRGYWSSASAFDRTGAKVAIRFTADARFVKPLLSTSFGVYDMSVVPTGETPALAA